MKHSFFSGTSVLLAAIAISLASCDKEYTDLDSGLDIEDQDFNIVTDEFTGVKAFTQATGPVQSNDLAINPLGILNNGTTFGVTKADFVSQVELTAAALATEFGVNPEIDSVALYIPYFASKATTDEDGRSTYRFTSLYSRGKMKLEVFESNYFINDFAPPAFTEAQRFYTNDSGLFLTRLKGADDQGNTSEGAPALNNSMDTEQNTEFSFSNKEIELWSADGSDDDTDPEIAYLAPGMRLMLNKNYFKKKILEAPAGKLTSNTAFRDYMRGLYFKTTAISSASSFGMLDFKKGTITIYYHQNTSPTDATRVAKTYVMNLSGNTVSLQDNTFGSTYETALQNPNPTEGDDRIYLKGGNGSVAYIDLFGNADVHGENPEDPDYSAPNGVPDKLDDMRNEKWMINEANLTFLIDKNALGTTVEPGRIYLYNADDNLPIADFTLDFTTVAGNPKNDKYIFGGILETVEGPSNVLGEKYTVRVTNHLRALLKEGAENVRLGLAVTENISAADNLKAKPGAEEILIPRGSVLHPFGTVIDARSIKLEIHYTKKITQ